jgi:Putative auto-transporter adhesin, head GIN domain
MTRIAFAAAFLLSTASGAVTGSGNVQHETRVVGEFSGVSVQSGIRGEVKIGKQHVDLEADDNVLPLVETIIDDGVLVVRFKPHLSLHTSSEVVVHVTAPSIDLLESSGGSKMQAELVPVDDLKIESSGGGDVQARQISVKHLRAAVSGGGALVLDGSADDVKLSMSGGSRCKGEKLQARALKLQASGGSTARLAVRESVSGSASGGSVVHVSGHPQTRVSTSGGSEIETE